MRFTHDSVLSCLKSSFVVPFDSEPVVNILLNTLESDKNPEPDLFETIKVLHDRPLINILKLSKERR